MKVFRFYPLLIGVATALQALPAPATVVTSVAYTTLDDAGAYNAFAGSNVGRPGYQGYGNAFAPSISGLLANIEVGINHVYTPKLVDVQIRLDNGAGFPLATTLTSGTLTTAGFFGATSTALATFTPSAPLYLTAGTGYWLLLTPHTSSNWDVWNDNSIGAMGGIASTSDGGVIWGAGSQQWQSAFRVNVVVVPEPSTLALGAAGIGILAIFRCRRLKCVLCRS
jgi:hypothetical protein